MSIIVVGAGLMGKPIADGLFQLGHNVYIVEPNLDDSLRAYFAGRNIPISGFAKSIEEFDHLNDVSAVISAAPYHVNHSIVDNCIKNRRRYADLGGNPDVSKSLSDALASAGIPHITDLGLAPGLGNIILEYGIKSNNVDGAELKIRVGGLPKNPSNGLGYNQVFSIDGLYNEYKGKCKVIKDRKVVEVDALSELEHLSFMGKKDDNSYEAFQTKGGLGNTVEYIQSLGVASLDYKTIRYNGHCGIIKFLLEDMDLTNDEFASIIRKTCPVSKDDVVLVRVSVTEQNGGTWLRWACIENNETYSAMQMATGYPTAVAVDILASGVLDNVLTVTYKDIPFDAFFTKLSNFGIKNLI